MSTMGRVFRLLGRRPAFVVSLVLSFLIIFGLACIIAYKSYTKAIEATIRSNETRAILLAKLILEHQRAAIGVLESYANRLELARKVKKKDFEGTLRELADLVKNNPEMEWPFISNPDSTIWINYPVDRQVMNRDLSYRDWYKGVKREWKPYISSVYKLLVGEKDLAVAVSVPIHDEKGKVIGILSTAQSTAFFQKIIGEVGSNLDAKITLVDQERHIIYSNGFPYTKEIIGYPPFEPVERTLTGEKGNVKVRDVPGRARIKYVSLAPIEGIGWSVIVEKARNEVLRSEALYLVLIAVISLLIYGVVVLSLIHLRERYRQIKQLKKLNEELDGRVRERTAELEAGNKALRESEERLRFALETSHTGAWDLDLVDHSAHRSLEHDRIFGYMQLLPQWTYEMFLDHVLPMDRATVDAKFRAATAAGSDWNFECRIRRVDGEVRWIWAAGRHLENTTGSARRMAGIVQDITERKQAEEALRRSEEKYRDLIKYAATGIYEVDFRTPRFSSVNDVICQYLGYTREELLRMNPSEIMDEKNASLFRERIRKQLSGEKVDDSLEYRVRAKDGREYDAVLHITFTYEDGKPKGAMVIAHDITERKRAEESLRESQTLLSTIIESTPDPVYVKDKESRIAMANRALAKVVGKPLEEILGKTDSEYYGDLGTGQVLREHDLRVMKSGQNEVTEETVPTPEGYRTFLSSKSPYRNASGDIVGITGISRDITELKQVEEAQRRSEARFRLLSETAGRLLATDEPQRIVEELCSDVMKYLDCHTFFNFLIDESAGRLRLNACAGIPEEEARKIQWLDYGTAVCGCVAQEHCRIIAEDIFHVPDPRTELIKSYGIQAYCCHPLMVQGRLIGTLSFGTRTRPSFTDEEVDVMKTVTDQVAMAMQRIQTERALRQHALELQNLNETLEQRVRERTAELANLSSQLVSAQENERKRVSYDLHDNVWQTLLAIRFKIESLFSNHEDWEALGRKSKEITEDIQGAIGKIRSMQGDLWPYVLDDIGIRATIDWYCREFEKEHSGLTIENHIDLGEHEVPSSAKIVIYRVMQEAMSNVAKHSQANHVSLSLANRDHRVEFTITDNGIGFDPEETLAKRAPWGGLGFLSIKARTELSGGSFGVESVKGKGTTVRVSWPI